MIPVALAVALAWGAAVAWRRAGADPSAARRAGVLMLAAALAWNILGLALLVNVVTVAILGTPRFQYFGPDHLNVWVMQPPFVWLAAVMLLAALAGHLLVFRALVLQKR